MPDVAHHAVHIEPLGTQVVHRLPKSRLVNVPSTTLAPRRANSVPVANPMPLAPPVMTAPRPETRPQHATLFQAVTRVDCAGRA